jgi:hypothetical protein
MSDEADNHDENDEDGRKPGRLSRLRFSKKKDMPGGLWLKCENCGTMIYRKELEAADRVCPSCSFHFTLPGRQRIEALCDQGSWEELYADLKGLDRLSFTDKIPYAEKLERTARSCSRCSTSRSSAGRWGRSWARSSRWPVTRRARKGARWSASPAPVGLACTRVRSS